MLQQANSQPRFSVVVPIHNAEDYLEECLDSLVKQTFRDIEIICVVNGSTDRSEEIVRDYAEKDSRISVHVLSSAGLSIARNYGIKVAKGDYVGFVDSDDWVDETLYELADNKLKQTDVDCLLHCIWNVRGQKKVRNKSCDRLIEKVGEAPFSYSEFPRECINITASCYSKIIRRKLLIDNKIFFGEELKSAEDTAFCMELYHRSKKLVVLNKELYYYRVLPVGNSVTTKTPLKEIAKSCDYCLAKLDDILNSENKALIVNRFLQTILFVHKRVGSPSDMETISAIEYLYKKLPIAFRLREKDEPKRARKLLLKTKARKLVGKLFSISKTSQYSYVRLFGLEFKRFRSSYRRVFQKQELLRQQYRTLVTKLKSRDEKNYRIGFVVAQIQKWKCQSLFDLMKLEKQLHPVIVIVPFFEKGESVADVEKRIRENEAYFISKNMNYVLAWDFEKKQAVSLESFDFDIVFYQQPWSINKKHLISEVSKRSLTYYVPYYVPNYGNLKYDCMPFHFQLFRYYVLNQSWKDLYLTVMDGHENELCPVGHPTLDYFLDHEKVIDKQAVIYAPHHSLQAGSIGYGTFKWSGQEILQFAKSHPEINWVFKPHPKLKSTLISSKVMTEEEVESYWAAWMALGEVYEGGDYMPLFNDSSCMITDCGSFLVEYFYTGNPVIHMTSSRTQEPISALKEITDCYYQVATKGDLVKRLDELLLKKQDILKPKRLEKLQTTLKGQQSCSAKILKDIKDTLGII